MPGHSMPYKWNFVLHKILILYLCGIVIGGEIELLLTNNVSLITGILEIIAMLLVTLTVVLSCRTKETV